MDSKYLVEFFFIKIDHQDVGKGGECSGIEKRIHRSRNRLVPLPDFWTFHRLFLVSEWYDSTYSGVFSAPLEFVMQWAAVKTYHLLISDAPQP